MILTIAQFLAVFPATPFSLHYVARGPAGERSFGWHASFTSSYWTSDSGRIYHHKPPRAGRDFVDGWGSTPEEALGALAAGVLDSLRRSAKAEADVQRARERDADDLEKRLEGIR